MSETFNVARINESFARTGVLSIDHLERIVSSAGDSSLDDTSLAGFLMALFTRENSGQPLSAGHVSAMTLAMARSGVVFDWSGLDNPIAARHTPGCVGDIQSGPVDAILRSLGFLSPNITGVRLLHTPGTTESFASIPGFNYRLSPEQVYSQMNSVGMVLTGQSAKITPADGRLYGIRERIGAVDSVTLIASSVMSKKIASGAKHLSLMVTYGPGAIVQTRAKAERLAALMVTIGQNLGISVVGRMFYALDAMSRRIGTGTLGMLGRIYAVRNSAPPDELQVILCSAAATLLSAGVEPNFVAALKRARRAIESGEAAEWLARMISAQGGGTNVVDKPGTLGIAKYRETLHAQREGWVRPNLAVMGSIAHELTGGFLAEDWYPLGGFIVTEKGRRGARVQMGDVLCEIHANDSSAAGAVRERLRAAFELCNSPVEVSERFSPLPEPAL